MTLKYTQQIWFDNPKSHQFIHDEYCKCVNDNKELKEYRDWIETNNFGFGERSFIWLWKLLVDEMPENFKFLEIGVYKGQIITLIELLANQINKKCMRFGISPFDNTDGYQDSNYIDDLMYLHYIFRLSGLNLRLLNGLSTSFDIIEQASERKYNLLYIDGGHSYEVIKSDLNNYCDLVNVGGFLVIDDSANNLNLADSMFKGKEDVTRAVNEYMTNNKNFEFLFNVIHNRIYKRICV
jgi:hypothetical protein